MAKYIIVLFLVLSVIISSGLILKHKIRKRVNNLITTRLNKNAFPATMTNIAYSNPQVIANNLEYNYGRLYSGFRKNLHKFNQLLKNTNLTQSSINERTKLEQTCNFQIDEAIDRITLAKAYDCLARLHVLKKDKADIFRAINSSSNALNIFYLKKYAKNLANFIIKDHKTKIFSQLDNLTEENILDFFSGYAKDEEPFLQKLLNLNINDLSAKVLYRLSMIHILGGASSLEKINPSLVKASQEQNKVIELTKIKPKNITDIVFTINDKYGIHAATTMASAIINSDLDSYYNFYFLIDPTDPISKEMQDKLSSLQNIRAHSIKFINVDLNLLPIDLIKDRSEGLSNSGRHGHWPLLVMFRAYLPTILPNLKTVLSLDADIIVLRDLSYFKTIDMQDYFIAGAYEPGNPRSDRIKCKQNIPNYYINAGVMLLNLENLRNNNFQEIIKQSFQRKECKFEYNEQDLLNLSFVDRIYPVAYKWNFRKFDLNLLISMPKFIIHYAGTNHKPWNKPKESLSDIDNIYWYYRELIPWMDYASGGLIVKCKNILKPKERLPMKMLCLNWCNASIKRITYKWNMPIKNLSINYITTRYFLHS